MCTTTKELGKIYLHNQKACGFWKSVGVIACDLIEIIKAMIELCTTEDILSNLNNCNSLCKVTGPVINGTHEGTTVFVQCTKVRG